MGSTDLALSWKDHHGVLFNVFEKLLAKKSLVDCTLAAEGKFLKAHRIVLSACSPYFEALLDQEYDKHPIIFLRDVQFEDLKTLLEFVYSGEIKIPENRLVEFLNVAEALQIKGLGGVGNEGQVSKSSADSLPRKETRSPVPRKRSRRHSSSSDGSSRDRAEIIPVNAESSRPKSGSENIVPVTNNASVSQPVPHQSSVVPSEDLNPNVKVKQEIITPVQSTCADQLASDQSGENEEILGLKPEFEQVTFTEDYSDDMLPEDSDSVDHVIDQDQPSSSQQYSGFSAESVKPGELSIHPPFAVGGVNQPVPEENLKTYIDKKCEDLLTLINKNKRSFLYDLQKVREEFLLRHEKFELSETLQEFSFPISDITEFKRYDSMIVERKTLRNELIFSMANQCLGITDYKEAIRRILKNIMSKSVQIKYCASGRAMKEEKENFSATKIFECLKMVIADRYQKSGQDLTSYLSRWLTGAIDRDGGRASRKLQHK